MYVGILSRRRWRKMRLCIERSTWKENEKNCGNVGWPGCLAVGGSEFDTSHSWDLSSSDTVRSASGVWRRLRVVGAEYRRERVILAGLLDSKGANRVPWSQECESDSIVCLVKASSCCEGLFEAPWYSVDVWETVSWPWYADVGVLSCTGCASYVVTRAE